MVRYIFLLVVCMAFGLHSAGAQQRQAQVVLQIQPPPPNQLSMADLWRISLINSARGAIEVQLHGTIEAAEDGLIGSGRSSVFTIQPGMNRLTGSHVEPVSVDYADNRYRDAILRTGGVPPGEYTLCVWAVDPPSGRELSRDCIRHQVETFTPPELISPVRGASVRTQDLIFTWTPLSPVARRMRVSYHFRLVQMMGDQPADVAIQSNPAWYETNTSGLSVQMTGTSSRFNRLDPGPYSWSVVARDENSGMILGRSEISFFTLLDELEDEEPLADAALEPEVEPAFEATITPHGLPQAILDELLTPCTGGADLGMAPVLPEDRIIIRGEPEIFEYQQFELNQD